MAAIYVFLLFVVLLSNPLPQVLSAQLLSKGVLNFGLYFSSSIVRFILALEVKETKVTEENIDGAHLITGAPEVEGHIGGHGALPGRPCGLPGRVIPVVVTGATGANSPELALMQRPMSWVATAVQHANRMRPPSWSFSQSAREREV